MEKELAKKRAKELCSRLTLKEKIGAKPTDFQRGIP